MVTGEGRWWVRMIGLVQRAGQSRAARRRKLVQEARDSGRANALLNSEVKISNVFTQVLWWVGPWWVLQGRDW